MDSRSHPPYTDTSRSSSFAGRANIRARRRHIAAASVLIAALAALLAFILVVIIRLVVVLPTLPPPTLKPSRQPGGLLRQVIGGGESSHGEWSSDGKRLATTLDDVEKRQQFLADIWDSMRRVGAAPRTFPATLWVLAIIGEDGKDAQVIRMPQGLNPTWVRWQPGSSNLAVGALRMTADRQRVCDEWGLWLFDTATRRLLKHVYDHAIGFESWSPDGRKLLYQASAHLRERDPYRVVTPATGVTVDVPQPGKPNWIDRPQWSPDSRRIAFRYHSGPASPRRPGHLPARGIWLVDVRTATARLLTTGRIGATCWLSDGRVVVMRANHPFTAMASSQVGVVDLQSGGVEWFPWMLRGACSQIEEAKGCIIAQMLRWRRAKNGKEQVESDLWQVNMADGSQRRLTELGHAVDRWSLSPQGDKVSLCSWDEGALPGTWILDLGP